MKRGECIKDPIAALDLIINGKSLFHEKVVMSAGQLKTRNFSWLIDKVKEGKIYAVKVAEVSVAAKRFMFYEDCLSIGMSSDVLDRFIEYRTTGKRPVHSVFPFTVVWNENNI